MCIWQIDQTAHIANIVPSFRGCYREQLSLETGVAPTRQQHVGRDSSSTASLKVNRSVALGSLAAIDFYTVGRVM